VAYQTVTRLRRNSPNGTVRSTARRVQSRAWPTPRTWRAWAKEPQSLTAGRIW
jgi:hypothetical protein